MGRPGSMFYWKGRGFATDAGGQRTLLVKGPKTKANRELAQQKLAELLGRPPSAPKPDANLTLAAVIDQQLEWSAARVAAGELKENSLDRYYRPYCRLLQAECGSWKANAIGQPQILAYRRRLAQRNLKHNTIKNRLGVLRTVLRWAERTGLITQTCHDAVPCLPRHRRQHIPSADELARLCDAARHDVREVLVALLNLPVRPGDCYALRRKSVDLEAGLLHHGTSCALPTGEEQVNAGKSGPHSGPYFWSAERPRLRFTKRHQARPVMSRSFWLAGNCWIEDKKGHDAKLGMVNRSRGA